MYGLPVSCDASDYSGSGASAAEDSPYKCKLVGSPCRGWPLVVGEMGERTDFEAS